MLNYITDIARRESQPIEPDHRIHYTYTYREIALGHSMTSMWIDEAATVHTRRMPGYGRADTYTDVEPEDL